MSENAIILVELNLPANNAEARAEEVARWLLAEGIIAPNPNPGTLHQPSDYLPGPKVLAVAPDARQFLPDPPRSIGLSNSGVDFITERQLHHPVENYEPPPCPNCGERLDEDVHYGLVEEWTEGPEPMVECPNCGESRLIGDWVHEFTFYVSNLAVRFNNWSPLTDEFVRNLGARLGPRSRMLLEHT